MELRWIEKFDKGYSRTLQYRHIGKIAMDWQDVPTVEEEKERQYECCGNLHWPPTCNYCSKCGHKFGEIKL